MCELFGLSCADMDRATISLPVFAEKGSWCRHGWGLAYYDSRGEAQVVRRARPVAEDREEWFKEVQKARGNIIVAHLRFRTSGKLCKENCHPFSFSFLEKHWIFAHNGRWEADYPSRVGGDSDSASLFTFMMDRIMEYYTSGVIRGLYPAVKKSIIEAFRRDPNCRLNFILSDGINMYVFHHYPKTPIYWLRRSKDYGNATLVTTKRGLTRESWQELPADELLVLSRGDILVFSNNIKNAITIHGARTDS